MANEISTYVKCKGSHIKLAQSSFFFFFFVRWFLFYLLRSKMFFLCSCLFINKFLHTNMWPSLFLEFLHSFKSEFYISAVTFFASVIFISSVRSYYFYRLCNKFGILHIVVLQVSVNEMTLQLEAAVTELTFSVHFPRELQNKNPYKFQRSIGCLAVVAWGKQIK